MAAIQRWMSGAGGCDQPSGILIADRRATNRLHTVHLITPLAAAIMGRFTLMVPAVLGGLAIGMVQSEMTYLQGPGTATLVRPG